MANSFHPFTKESITTLFRIEAGLFWLEEDLVQRSLKHIPDTSRPERVQELKSILGDEFYTLFNKSDSAWYAALSILKNMASEIQTEFPDKASHKLNQLIILLWRLNKISAGMNFQTETIMVKINALQKLLDDIDEPYSPQAIILIALQQAQREVLDIYVAMHPFETRH